MEHGRVLIVSEDPKRRNFLEYYVRKYSLSPIWYPNVFASAKAIKDDPFDLIVIDLSIPVEPKLTLAKNACVLQPNAKMITIDKFGYLEKGFFSPDFPTMQRIPSIDDFPQKIKEYIV